MLKFAKAHKNKVKAVSVYNISRFSRTGSTTIIEELEKLGIAVFSATSDYDPRVPEGKLIQGMELTYARYDNATKSRTTKDNGRKALLNGRWIHQAPIGYDMKTTRAKQEITINDKGKLIREYIIRKLRILNLLE